MDLQLNDKHEYTLNGRRVPGVTEVIRHFVPAWNCGQWYLDRGKAVHKAVALALTNKLDWSSVDPRIVKRVTSIHQFVIGNGLACYTVEESIGSVRYQFAGTLDFVGMTTGSRLVLCDWKSQIEPATLVQLGGYRVLWEDRKPRAIVQAVAVQVDDDGALGCETIRGSALVNASNTFLNMLSVYGWKLKHGLIKKEENGTNK